MAGDGDVGHLKQAVQAEIDRLVPDLFAVSRFLHANPELAYEERQAAELLADVLEQHGFAVTRGVANLPTAFTGLAGSGGPRVAFMAEYDALPGLGHACGHNLIGTASLGAALAVRSVLDRASGTVLLVGCPAEEKGGGKIALVEAGVFAGTDAAMLVHPSNRTEMVKLALGMRELTVEFFGKASHAAAAPDQGVNALDAVVLAYTGIGVLTTAGTFRCADPRHHHARGAGPEHHPGVRRRTVLRPRPGFGLHGRTLRTRGLVL